MSHVDEFKFLLKEIESKLNTKITDKMILSVVKNIYVKLQYNVEKTVQVVLNGFEAEKKYPRRFASCTFDLDLLSLKLISFGFVNNQDFLYLTIVINDTIFDVVTNNNEKYMYVLVDKVFSYPYNIKLLKENNEELKVDCAFKILNSSYYFSETNK